MLTVSQIDSLPGETIALYQDYEDSILRDIARRLAGLDFATPTAAWQMQRLTESGLVFENALKELAQLTGKSYVALRSMFEKAGVMAVRFDDKIYRAAGLNPLPLNLSPAMVNVLAAGLTKTGGVMTNMTLTTAISGQQAFVNAADLAYMQVTSGAMSYDQAIRAAVKSVAAEGISTIDFASGRRDPLDVAMRRTVLTGVAQTTGNLQMARADEMGTDLVQTSAHAGARPTHEVWQGQVFSRSGTNPKYPDFVSSTDYGSVTGLCGINCVLGDTIVSGAVASVFDRRKYSGEIVVIHTAGGKELSVTPNHKILTRQGWINADLLTNRDYVISRGTGNRTLDSSPNHDNSPSSIQEVFSSLSEIVGVFPGSPRDFHGDGSDSNVNIIFANRLLGNRRDISIAEQFIQGFFGSTGKSSGSFFSEGALAEIGVSSFHSPNGIMRGFRYSQATFLPGAGQPDTHGFGAIGSDGNTMLSEAFGDNEFRTSELQSNSPLRHAGIIEMDDFFFVQGKPTFNPRSPSREPQFGKALLDSAGDTSEMLSDIGFPHSPYIELDKIIFIERKQLTSTHVYNLQSETGWYYANGIITHNCRHSFYPFFEGISENAYSEADRQELADKTVNLDGKEVSQYQASQVQRGIERKIRDWKRQAGALEAAGLDNTTEAAKVSQWQAQMRDFIKQTKLQRQRVREQI
jgi:hypothetical protein